MNDERVPRPENADAIRDEHRELDELFGRFFGAAAGGSIADAVDAIARFDDALRFHTQMEEALFSAPPQKLHAPAAGETRAEALFRELRLEHVQIRELSGIVRRILTQSADLPGARALAAELARRWDAHTQREERELLGAE